MTRNERNAADGLLTKPLKEVVPEIVQPPAQQHPPAGEGHYFSDFCPLCLAITVDMAVLAGWLRLEWASAESLHRIRRQLHAVRTKKEPLAHAPSQSRRNLHRRFHLCRVGMLEPAVELHEAE